METFIIIWASVGVLAWQITFLREWRIEKKEYITTKDLRVGLFFGPIVFMTMLIVKLFFNPK